MKQEKGITIIALIITVILMIILVGVSIDFAIDKGLSDTAKKTGQDTEDEAEYEKMIAQGYVLNSKNEWVKLSELGSSSGGSSSGSDTGEDTTLPEGWSVATTTPTGWSTTVTPVTDGTNTIPIPSGFNMSQEEGEYTFSNGVVIKDSEENEFVWVPYNGNTASSYANVYASTDATAYSNVYAANTGEYVEEDLAYTSDKTAIENTINKYGGFWIGRYVLTYNTFNETTGTYSGIGTKGADTKMRWYYSVSTDYTYYSSGAEYFQEIGSVSWEDFYEYSEIINTAGIYSKMITYCQREMAESIGNVQDKGMTEFTTTDVGDSYGSRAFWNGIDCQHKYEVNGNKRGCLGKDANDEYRGPFGGAYFTDWGLGQDVYSRVALTIE